MGTEAQVTTWACDWHLFEEGRRDSRGEPSLSPRGVELHCRAARASAGAGLVGGARHAPEGRVPFERHRRVISPASERGFQLLRIVTAVCCGQTFRFQSFWRVCRGVSASFANEVP